jgi:TonB family protein
MLHDRFYSAWIQPTTKVPSGEKISTLVNVRIEKDGRVSKFEIARPSGNATVNESVAAVARQISQVDPPPTGLIKGDHYDVKINFELNTEEKPENWPDYQLAIIYAWTGEKDLALEQLAFSAQIPAGVTYGRLKLDPEWDVLRSDPRFEKIVASLAPK